MGNSFLREPIQRWEMPVYSLKTAAEAVGLGKPAILKAIQKGRISAVKNANGQWEIDPAELHRVYQPVSVNSSQDKPSERWETDKEIIELRAGLDALRQVNAQLENERDDLRRRLDQESEERRKLTALLVHRSEEKPAPEAVTAEPPPTRATLRLAVVLITAALTALVASLWWLSWHR